MGALDSGAGEDGDLAGLVEQGSHLLHVHRVGGQDRATRRGVDGGRRHGLLIRDVTGQGDHGHALHRHGVADGGVDHARGLLGGGDELGVDRALGEQAVRMGLLEVGLTDLDAGDVGGDGEHRSA